MQFKIGKLVITIVAVEESTRARRKMARRVDILAREKAESNPGSSYIIQRIKAYRELNNLEPGLRDSKEWVESAFADNGRGVVL